METKKSSQADVDRRSTQNFLLGAVVVVAALFVALEWDFTVDDSTADADALEEIVKELDLEKLKEEQRIPLVTKPVVLTPKTLEQLHVVDEQPTEELKDEQMAPPAEEAELTDDESQVKPDQQADELSPLEMQVVEQLPEFPGGAVELMKWLTKNLHYPHAARQRKLQGRVLAQFIVNTDGSLSDYKVVESPSPLLDHEALRVLRMMPHWKPGQQDQKPCRTMVCIPIVFKL